MKAKWNENNELVDSTAVTEHKKAAQIALGEIAVEPVKDLAKSPEAYQQLAGQTSDPMTNPQPVDKNNVPVEAPAEPTKQPDKPTPQSLEPPAPPKIL